MLLHYPPIFNLIPIKIRSAFIATHIDQRDDRLVALASIAAELHSVLTVAWGVSLAAKNAKVISTQAADKLRGFQPIAEAIDEFSTLAINGVNEISEEALRLSKISVNEQRSVDAYHRFDSVRKKDGEAQYIQSMSAAMKRVERHMLESTQEFKKSFGQLNMLLESMGQCMLSARTLASVSRIVTSGSDEYRDALSAVADDLDKASSYIKEKLSDSYQHLDRVNLILKA